MNRPVEGWAANTYHQQLDLRGLMTSKELQELSKQVGYNPQWNHPKDKQTDGYQNDSLKDSQLMEHNRFLRARGGSKQSSNSQSHKHFEEFLRWNRKQSSQHEKYESPTKQSVQPTMPNRQKFQRYQPIRLGNYMLEDGDQSEVKKQLTMIERRVREEVERQTREQQENQRRVRMEEYQQSVESQRRKENPVDYCKDKLIQRMAQLDRVNRQIEQIAKTIKSSRIKDVGKVVEPTISDNEHFQHLVSNPPIKHSKSITNQAKPVMEPRMTNSICIQTDNKAQIATQTHQRRKRLDMSRILELSDHEFIDLFSSNREEIDLYATTDQKLTLNNRYTKITSQNNVRHILKQVLEQAPTSTLEKVSSKHKRKAYDFLYGSVV